MINKIKDLYLEIERSGVKIDTVELYKQIDCEAEDRDGNPIIFKAVGEADIDAVKYLISAGARTSVTNSNKDTLLHALADVCRMNRYYDVDASYELAKLLIDAKVSPLRKNEYGSTAYHVAASNGMYPLIQALIESGAKLDMTDNQGRNVLHLATSGYANIRTQLESAVNSRKRAAENPANDYIPHKLLEEAVIKKADNYVKIVKACYDYGIDPMDKDRDDKTVIDYSVERNTGIIPIILKGEYEEGGADMELKAATKGKNLHQACREGDIEAVDALIKLGADVNEVFTESPFIGQTPLSVACISLQPECADLLLANGADINYKNGDGQTAIYFMTRYAYENMPAQRNKSVQKLLRSISKSAIDINSPVDDNANTALIVSCYPKDNAYRINEQVFEMLINLGADVNATNLDGVTPLMVACGEPNENIIITLLENGAKLDIADKNGNTPLMYLAVNNNKTAAKDVADILAGFGSLSFNAVNNAGKSALELATENDNEALVKFILTNM